MLFAIRTFDHPDSGALRDELRAAHLAFLDRFADETVFDGPFTTDDGAMEMGSFKILDVKDRAAAQSHVDDEPFVTGGLQHGAAIWRFEPVVAHDWQSCPRNPDHVPALILGFDREGGRDPVLTVAEADWMRGLDGCLTAGTLVSDDGNAVLGSLLMVETPDMATARALWDASPAAMLFATVDSVRWRFGRTFDRLKPYAGHG